MTIRTQSSLSKEGKDDTRMKADKFTLLHWIKRKWKKIRIRFRLMHLDSLWLFYGGDSYELFPPSFYYTHSAEEIAELTEKNLSELRRIAQQYKTQNHLK